MSSLVVPVRPQLRSRARARRSIEVALSVAAAASLLAGCTTSSTSSSTTAKSTGATGTTAAAPADPNAGLKNGTQLKAALMTKKDLPAGFKISPDAVRDTANVFGPKSAPVKQTKADCTKLDTNAWVQGSGIGSASFAQTSFNDGFGDEADAEIDGFRGTDASTVMTNLRSLIKLCATYKTTTPGVGKTTVKVVTKAGPKVGDDSIRAVMTSKAWQGGTTLTAVKSGKSVITVLYSSSKSDLGAKAVTLAETMTKRLGTS